MGKKSKKRSADSTSESESSESESSESEPVHPERRSKRLRDRRKKQRELENAIMKMITSTKQVEKLPPPVFPKTWAELVKLCDEVGDQGSKYQDCDFIPRIREVVRDLDAMVGMNDIKEVLLYKIVSAAQRDPTESTKEKEADDHIVITGSSGVGKSTLARKIAVLLNRMNLIDSEKVVVGKRSNMIAEYVGQTARRTEKIMREAAGGCLLIDEAYELGGEPGHDTDSFSRECINTLNRGLLEGTFKCILVGYKEALKRQFFSQNEGLDRRFGWKIHVPDSSADQLANILHKFVRESGYEMPSETADAAWFETRRKKFPQNGGSVQNLFSKIKIAHSMRSFGLPKHEKKKITMEDVEKGMQMYDSFEGEKGESEVHAHMYM